MMAKILAYTSPARGHLYPIVDTLLALRRRGHEVHVKTLNSEIETLQEAGLNAQPIDPAIERVTLDTWKAATFEEGLAQAFATFAKRSEYEVPDFEKALDDVQPDAVIVDITTPGAAAVAESRRLPWAVSMPLFQHIAPPDRAPAVTMVPFGLAPPGVDVINGPRVRLGLPSLNARDQMWRAPLHLYYSAPPLTPPGLEYPESFRLLGPGLWEPSGDLPDDLDELGDPLIVVSVSSEYQRDDPLIEAALEGLTSDGLNLVITTAAHDPGSFRPMRNARLLRWGAHGPLLRRATCVVCHGGMGITQKALAAGVPLCVVPFGRDQFDVAARVSQLEAGTTVQPNELTPESLREAVHGAFLLRHGAENVARDFRKAGGPDAAANELEALISKWSDHFQGAIRQ